MSNSDAIVLTALRSIELDSDEVEATDDNKEKAIIQLATMLQEWVAMGIDVGVATAVADTELNEASGSTRAMISNLGVGLIMNLGDVVKIGMDKVVMHQKAAAADFTMLKATFPAS